MRNHDPHLQLPTVPQERNRLFHSSPISVFCLALALMLAPPAFAQEEDADDTEEVVEDGEAIDEETEVVVVTGSRLKRDTYNSVSPLQIITAEVSREAGLVDAGKILQESTASAGVQIDLTFQGFVLDEGPGAVTANLRGLGSNRTLVLINGRRIAPAGVEGAPTAPDLSIIPGTLVQQYDQLLDGASSVYGSDAIAGVVNVLLHKDFDGLEFETFPSFPAHGAGRQMTHGLRWGRNFDRGFIGFGAEYYEREPVTLDDRPWTRGCEKHYEIDQGGRIRTQGLWYAQNYGMEWDECALGALAARVFVPGTSTGSIYFTPGYSNGGWPDFSESSMYGFGVDGDGDGETDLTFRDYDLNGRTQFAHLFGDSKITNMMGYGEYTLEGDMNLTPYFEALYSTRDYYADGGVYQLFPDVPANNPYNICNPNGAGVDCGLAQDALFTNPNFVAQFSNRWEGLCAQYGIPKAACTPGVFGLIGGPSGPVPSLPIVAVRGDRTITDTSVTQSRYVAGMSGDLPMLNRGTLTNWTFDVSATYSESKGISSRPGVREDRLNLALGAYSTTNTPCENDTGEELADDAAPGCVPVDMFHPSLYATVVGDFGTTAERNYVFDSRDFDTRYMQTLYQGFITGDLYQLPAGAVSAGVGLEYRIDEIKSLPDAVARDGLFFGYFSDGGAEGSKYTQEAFGEVEVPIVGNLPGARELDLNVSARWTDDEFYGGAWTGSGKLAWRPIDSLLIRATYGTSYRAPNVRELFLRAQTGFLTVGDPCLIPESAIDPIQGGYDPDLDLREQHVLDNCRANGVDPTFAHNDGYNSYSVEVAAGGRLNLDEETSESQAYGFAWEQPFTTAFDMTISMWYYTIEIDNTIIEPSAGFIVGDCYYSLTGTSTFCDRITRDADPERPLMNYVDRGFINRDNETVRGVDLNISFDTTVTLFDLPFEVSLEGRGHRQIERSTLFVNDQGDRDFDTYHREWAYPERKASINLRVGYDRWSVAWTSRHQGRVFQDVDGVDEWSDINGFSHTCLGPPDDVLCRDVGTAGNYWVHSVSTAYRGDIWLLRLGARNVFDEAPPQVDGSERWTTWNNTPRGDGYDLDGRVMFMEARINLGAGG